MRTQGRLTACHSITTVRGRRWVEPQQTHTTHHTHTTHCPPVCIHYNGRHVQLTMGVHSQLSKLPHRKLKQRCSKDHMIRSCFERIRQHHSLQPTAWMYGKHTHAHEHTHEHTYIHVHAQTDRQTDKPHNFTWWYYCTIQRVVTACLAQSDRTALEDTANNGGWSDRFQLQRYASNSLPAHRHTHTCTNTTPVIAHKYW